ncbi:MAG: response regulator transcription factor [Pseudomonadota bacterium]
MIENKHVKVLIVEDNPVIRYMLRHILNTGGYTVIGEAAGSQRGFELTRELKPDLVCLDILMPGNSGLDTLKQIKQHFPHIAVIMVSANSRSETLQAALDDGADGYILKPFKAEALLHSVAQAIEKIQKIGLEPSSPPVPSKNN